MIFHILYRSVPIVFFFVHCIIYSRTKPVEGAVISDSSKYLSNVSIVSLPSLRSTKTNTEGSFYFEIPVDDKKIAFNLRFNCNFSKTAFGIMID